MEYRIVDLFVAQVVEVRKEVFNPEPRDITSLLQLGKEQILYIVILTLPRKLSQSYPFRGRYLDMMLFPQST